MANRAYSGAWIATFPAPASHALAVSGKLENAPVVSLIEAEAANDWRVEILFPEKPDRDDVARMVAWVYSDLKLAIPDITWQPVEDRDWVAESQKLLSPIEAGRFFVHGAHDKDKLPNGKIMLEIEAGPAFGTGHHETTKGCLLALDRMAADGLLPDSALDLGCGSGILALAMAKLWPDCQIIGSDIDPIAVKTAGENADKNQTPDIQFITADGLNHPDLTEATPFDLIVANILAGPLVDMALALRKACRPGTIVILSGLMRNQESETLTAYLQQGFHHLGNNYDGDWAILSLQV